MPLFIEAANMAADPFFGGLIVLAVLWTIPWKAVALWKAARANQKIWFVILLCVNTLAILEIVYIYLVLPRQKKNKTLVP